MVRGTFDLKRKEEDIILDTINSETYQRKILELKNELDKKIDNENNIYMKELELANNNEEELVRRTKIRDIEKDHAAKLLALQNNYEKNYRDIQDTFHIEKYSKPYYFKWMYMGPVGKYDRVLCGMSYYIKLNEFDVIEIYDDVKYSKFICSVKYLVDEWQEEHANRMV